MATTHSLISTVNVRVAATEAQGGIDNSAPADAPEIGYALRLLDGTGSKQNDKQWHDRRTLVATSEELDLAGSLTNVFGDTVTFAKIRAILIVNRSKVATEKLLIGGSAANAFINWVASSTDIIHIDAGGAFLLTSPIDGFAVTAGTGDKLKIDAGADTITYDIILLGTSA